MRLTSAARAALRVNRVALHRQVRQMVAQAVRVHFAPILELLVAICGTADGVNALGEAIALRTRRQRERSMASKCRERHTTWRDEGF